VSDVEVERADTAHGEHPGPARKTFPWLPDGSRRSVSRWHCIILNLGRQCLLPALTLASIGICIALSIVNKDPMLLPIEVLGDSGTTVSRTVTLQAEQAESVQSLWLQTNGLRYANQGSVQINASAWISLNNDTVAVAEPGKSFGGIGGGFATLQMTLSLPKGAVIAGPNIIRFRFNQTDGIASGYRVLAWNFMTREGSKIIPPDQFAEDAPESWLPPLSDAVSIRAGRELWQTASLLASSLRNSPKMQAHCADCHAHDGRDLKYFNFSNVSIVTRSRFHGLSTLQGEQIASYIRSLPYSNPGRPWNPPYQPGPGLDEQPVSNWAAGAGLFWVLDRDIDALPHLLNQRANGTSTPPSYSQPTPDLRDLVRQITPEIFRPDANLNARQIPIALQLPDWNQWLPRIHPKDAWGSAFSNSKFGELYSEETYPETTTATRTKPTLRTLFLASQSGNSNFRTVVHGFTEWSEARRAFLEQFVKSNTVWSPSFTDKVYSTQLWQLVKTWDMTQEFALEGRGRDLLGASADSRTWVNTIPAETAPSATHIPDGTAGVGGSALTNAYFTASWYELQILLNNGNHRHRDQSPIDWVYMAGRIRDLYLATHRPEPTRLLVAVIKALQSTDPRFGPDNFRQGWRPEQNIDPRIMVSPNWTPIFNPLPVEMHRAVTVSLLTAWIDKNLQYPIMSYLPSGTPPHAYTRSGTYEDITGGNVWEAAPQFREAGVPAELVGRLQEWGSSYMERASRLQYQPRRRSGKM
jgi:hypothetical protein